MAKLHGAPSLETAGQVEGTRNTLVEVLSSGSAAAIGEANVRLSRGLTNNNLDVHLSFSFYDIHETMFYQLSFSTLQSTSSMARCC